MSNLYNEIIKVIRNGTIPQYSTEELKEFSILIYQQEILDLFIEKFSFNPSVKYKIINKADNLRKIQIEKLMYELKEILNDFKFVFTKGKVLSYQIYGRDIRNYNDIDIFVLEKDFFPVHNKLIEHGYMFRNSTAKNPNLDYLKEVSTEFQYIKDGIRVEIKYYDDTLSKEYVAEMLERQIIINNLPTLSIEDSFIYLITTFYKNSASFLGCLYNYKLKDIIDLYYFIKNQKVNLEIIEDQMKSHNLQDVYIYFKYTFCFIFNRLDRCSIEERKTAERLSRLEYNEEYLSYIFDFGKRIQYLRNNHLKFLETCKACRRFYYNEFEIDNEWINMQIKNNSNSYIFQIKKPENEYNYSLYFITPNAKSNSLYLYQDITDKEIFEISNDLKYKGKLYFYLVVSKGFNEVIFNFGYSEYPVIIDF